MIETKALGAIAVAGAAPWIASSDGRIAAAVVCGAGLSILFMRPATRLEGLATVAAGLVLGGFLNGLGAMFVPPFPSEAVARAAVGIGFGLFSGALIRGFSALATVWARDPGELVNRAMTIWRALTGKGGA